MGKGGRGGGRLDSRTRAEDKKNRGIKRGGEQRDRQKSRREREMEKERGRWAGPL